MVFWFLKSYFFHNYIIREGGIVLKKIWTQFQSTMLKTFDLPADFIQNTPKVTMIGTQQVIIENHHGLHHFTEQQVQIKANQHIFLINGNDLELKLIHPEVIIIAGIIHEIKTMSEND